MVDLFVDLTAEENWSRIVFFAFEKCEGLNYKVEWMDIRRCSRRLFSFTWFLQTVQLVINYWKMFALPYCCSSLPISWCVLLVHRSYPPYWTNSFYSSRNFPQTVFWRVEMATKGVNTTRLRSSDDSLRKIRKPKSKNYFRGCTLACVLALTH